MKQYRILTAAIEAKEDKKGSHQALQVEAEVAPEAVEEAANFLKRKEAEEPEEDDKKLPKLPKLSLEARRNRKVKADLAEGARVLSQLREAGLRHCGELLTNLEDNLKLLKSSWSSYSEATLDLEEVAETAWKEVARVSMEVSIDITEASRRLNPAAKPWSTAFDPVLT